VSRVPYIHVVSYVLLYMARDRLLIEQKAIRNIKKKSDACKENGRVPKQGRRISGGSGRMSIHDGVV